MVYDIVFSCPEMRASKIHNRAHAGISYLRSFLEFKGLKTKYARHRKPLTLNEYIEFLLESNTEIYSFSVTDETLELFLIIASKLKEKKEDVFVIVGGAIAKVESAEYLLKNLNVDAVIIGEGEISTFEFINMIKEHGCINNEKAVKGVAIRNGKSMIFKNRDEEIDINSYPSPILSGFVEKEDLTENGIFSSRGCIHRCIFCGFSSKSEWKVRYYNELRFLSEFEYIIENVDESLVNFEIPIWDDTFTLNVGRAKKLLKRMASINHRGQKFWLQTRIDYADEELIELMKLAGIEHIGIGLESASPKVLKNIAKVRLNDFENELLDREYAYLNKFKDLLFWCRKHRLNYTINIILGLPGETYEDGLETIKLVKESRPKFYFHAYVKLYTGVPLARRYSEFGYKIKSINKLENDRAHPVCAEITKYPYDVNKIPKLANRLHHVDIMAVTGLIKDTIEYLPTVIVDNYSILSEVYDLNYLSGKLIYLKTIKTKKIENNINIKEINYKPTKIYTGISSRDTFTSIEVKLSDLNSFVSHVADGFSKLSLERYIKYADTLIELKIESLHEYETLLKISEITKTGGSFSLPDYILSVQFAGFVLKDSCRWSTYCSAEKNKRSYIDMKGKLRTCENGLVLSDGAYFDNDIIDQFELKYNYRNYEKKCENCISLHKCSKCMVIETEFQEIYCKIQRSMININDVFIAIDYIIKQIIDPLDTSVWKSENTVTFAPNCKEEEYILLLKFGDKYFYAIKRESYEILEIELLLYQGLEAIWTNKLDIFKDSIKKKFSLTSLEVEEIVNEISNYNIN